MVASKLTVYAYQELLDVGWRRSGTYVYRPEPTGSCCPAYTIRLDATEFTATPAQRRVLRRFESFCSGDWARRQRARLEQQGPTPQAASTCTAAAEAIATAPIAPAGQVDVAAVAEQAAVLCSEAFARHLPSSVTPAVAAALETSHPMFTVKQRSTADAHTPEEANQTVCLHSAVCWKAAAQTAPAPASSRAASPVAKAACAASGAPSPTPPLSKSKAKKARKAAARAAVAAGGASSPPVSAVATQIAEALLPAVRSMLAAHAAMSPLSPVATAERGHLHVALRVPATVPDAGGPELRALLQCRAPAAVPSAPAPAAPATEGGSVISAESIPAPGMACAHESDSGESEESMGSDAEWSMQSSDRCSDHSTEEAQQQRPQWWLEDPPEGGWQLRMVLQPSSFVEEEYKLYQRYQTVVHRDPPGKASRRGFERFLVEAPWQAPVPCTADADAPDCGYGAFHMQYWLGDHLIAVGVWDILPRCARPNPPPPPQGRGSPRVCALPCMSPDKNSHHAKCARPHCRCLSSKYFIWDPDLPFLSLGKFSALKEVEWVRAVHAAGARTLRYAYLGLYIHSNQKMRCAPHPLPASPAGCAYANCISTAACCR